MQDSSLETLIGQVADEYTDCLARGETPDIETFVARHPRHASAIRGTLQALHALHAEGPDPLAPSAASDEECYTSLPQLGDFILRCEIGRGGMGIVYEGFQRSLERRVAIKILPFANMLDQRQLQRFRTEARAAASLHHPHIVPVYSVGEERGVHYYAMQYVSGRSLAEYVRMERGESVGGSDFRDTSTEVFSPTDSEDLQGQWDDSRFSNESKEARAEDASSGDGRRQSVARFQNVANWGVQIAAALDYAHSAGIIHRDIKPSNLLLDGNGKVWVTDFGLARILDSPDVTMTGDLVGTIRYMSPEQAAGRRALIDERSDVYSLGATLYELLTLKPMFEGEDRQHILKRLLETEPVPPRRHDRSIPADLEKIVLKAVSKERELRYATPKEMAEDLQRFLDHVPVRAASPTVTYRMSKWLRRHQGLVLTALAVLSLLLAFSSVWLVLYRSVNAELEQALRIAEDGRLLVERERTRAEKALFQNRQSSYLQDLRSAGELWRDGDLQHAAEVLQASVPEQGQADLRTFEWHVLSNLSHPGESGIQVSALPLYSVTSSPDGKWVAAAGQEPTVRVYEVASQRKVAEIATGQIEVNQASFSPDGAELATAGDDGRVILWDWRTATPRRTLAGHQNSVFGRDLFTEQQAPRLGRQRRTRAPLGSDDGRTFGNVPIRK